MLKYGLCFFIVVCQQLPNNTELIGSLGTPCSAGNSSIVVTGKNEQTSKEKDTFLSNFLSCFLVTVRWAVCFYGSKYKRHSTD